MAVIPQKAAVVTFTDVELVKKRLGYAGVTSESPTSERFDFWERARADGVMFTGTRLYDDSSVMSLDYSWTGEDVAWEVDFVLTEDGCHRSMLCDTSHGFVLGLRRDLDWSVVTKSLQDNGFAADPTNVETFRTDDPKAPFELVHLIPELHAIAGGNELGLQRISDVVDGAPPYAPLLGPIYDRLDTVESMHAATGCVDLPTALGPDATTDDIAAFLKKNPIDDLTSPVSTTVVVSDRRAADIEVEVGAQAPADDLAVRQTAIESWPGLQTGIPFAEVAAVRGERADAYESFDVEVVRPTHVPRHGADRRRTVGAVSVLGGRVTSRLLSRRALGLGIVALLLMAAMVALGMWQLGVYDDHQHDDARARLERAPVPLSEVIGPDDAFPSDGVSRPVTVTGRYLSNEEFTVRDSDTLDVTSAVVTPLVLENGSAVLVVRGEDDGIPAPTGEVEVTGVLEPSDATGCRPRRRPGHRRHPHRHGGERRRLRPVRRLRHPHGQQPAGCVDAGSSSDARPLPLGGRSQPRLRRPVVGVRRVRGLHVVADRHRADAAEERPRGRAVIAQVGRIASAPMSTQQGTTEVPEDIRTRLTFFKVMAIIVGCGLLLLVLGMILRYGFGHPTLSKTWSPIHGFLYIVYLISTAMLGVKAGWTLSKMVGVMLAGTVPFLSFWMERRVVRSFTRPSA